MAAEHVGDSATPLRSRTGASGTEHGRGSAAEELRVAWDGWSAAITAGYGEHPGSLHRKLHSDFLLRPRPVCQGVSEPPGKRQRASESQPGAPAQDAGVAPPGGAPEGSTPEASSTAGPAAQPGGVVVELGGDLGGSVLGPLATPLGGFGGVPIVDPAGEGALIEALSRYGAVFVRAGPFAGGGDLPDVEFAGWHGLWQEALMRPSLFWSRPVLQRRTLKYSKGEDLARTLHGSAKEHLPDVRYNFGTGLASTRAPVEDWGDLRWIPEKFRQLFQWTQALVRHELASMSSGEPHWTLGAKVRDGREGWAGTNLRHSIYPAGGSCTEHTDYGVITLQQSTTDGLEGFIEGEWRPLQPPEGCALVFAGDMLERLTSGHVPALKHRVCLSLPVVNAVRRGAPAARQAHILFLQPDKGTVVQPLRRYAKGDGSDPPPIVYRDWHRMKASLAFRWD